MKCRVFCSFIRKGRFWSFAPVLIYGGGSYFGIGILGIVAEFQKKVTWEF